MQSQKAVAATRSSRYCLLGFAEQYDSASILCIIELIFVAKKTHTNYNFGVYRTSIESLLE